MVTSEEALPITAICIVADKNEVPIGFVPIDKAYDDKDAEADVWKDSFFAFSRIYRYICISRTHPENALSPNVVADIAIVNHGDSHPPNFIPLEYTEDTKEKALRKKQLSVRTLDANNATDAISHLILLTKSKRAPPNYTLVGEIDGLLVCQKYSTIPKDYVATHFLARQKPPLPYSHSQANGMQSNQYGYSQVPGPNPAAGLVSQVQSVNLQRQTSVKVYGYIDGVPFQLHPKLRAQQNGAHDSLPPLPDASASRLDAEYNYSFRLEQTVLETALTS